jgi:hypothetical protein
MRRCSLCKKLQIVPGCRDDYEKLAHYHYRESKLRSYTAMFALKTQRCGGLRRQTVGVIVYKMPTPGAELRNIATGGLFAGFDRATQLVLLNKNVRCINRVIIEPRFRSLGLASGLVRETMPKINVPIIEAMAVMGLVNPFLEKAGMRAYKPKIQERCVRLVEALSMVGIESKELIDPQKVQGKLDRLPAASAEFIEFEIYRFLQSYSSARYSRAGLERTRYILSKLTERPLYYIWFNPKLKLRAS